MGRKRSLEKIEANWQTWVMELFPSYCTYPFADFHIEAWDWAWALELGMPPKEDLAMIVFRGGGKSTTTELIITMLAAMRKRMYCWYIAGTQDQADNHIQNVCTLMETDEIDRYYPDIGTRQVGKHGNLRGWRRNRLWTKAGFVADAIGLDKASRGGKISEQRPDLMVPDEIDALQDTLGESRRKIHTITHSLLPAGSEDLAVLATQNLVNNHSFFKALADPDNGDFLANRRIIGPIPAINGLKTERRGRYDVIVQGEATWAGFDLQNCQDKINRWGLPAFLAECQHLVGLVQKGRVFDEWRETHHIITKREFMDAFGDLAKDEEGRFRFPLEGQCGMAQDYGSSIGHPCATAWAWRPPEKYPFNDCVFVIGELILPEFPARKDHEPVTVKRVARSIHKFEAEYNIAQRIKIRKFSHEQTAALNTYLFDLDPPDKIAFSKWRPDARAGIAPIQNHLQIDWNKEHPFRRFPVGHEFEGKPLLGRPRVFFLVDDGQGELWYDDNSDELMVKDAIDSGGFIRARFEIPLYHNPENPEGIEKALPKRVDNDFIDAWRGLFDYFAPRSAKRTFREKLEEKLPEGLRLDEIRDIEDKDVQIGMWEARQIELDTMERRKTLKISHTRKPYIREKNRMRIR